MSEPRVSVIMGAYNAERYLAQAVESILGQTFADLEFLVIDDGSTDGTRQILDQYAARDPRLTVRTRANRGHERTLNELLGLARAPLVARMDADDVSLPERLEKQVAFLDAHPDHGLVGAQTVQIDERGDPIPDREFGVRLTHEDIVGVLQEWSPFVHPTVMYRRDVVLGVGGYRPIFRHAEDWDLWLRLSPATKLANLPDRLMLYRLHGGQLSTRYLAEQTRSFVLALLSHRAVLAGLPDPLAGSEALPADGELDALFGPGAAAWAAGRIFAEIAHDPEQVARDGWPATLAHFRAGGERRGHRKLPLRLLRRGHVLKAARLAAAMARQPG